MKAELHIELFRACCHPQRVLCPLPVPGPNLRCCLGQSRMDSLGTAGCHWGLWSDWSSGRDWGKFLEVFRNFQFCFATLAPSWLELWQLPQSCSSFPMRKRLRSNFSVCLWQSLLYPKQCVSCYLGAALLGQWLNYPQESVLCGPRPGKAWISPLAWVGNGFTCLCLICFFWNSTLCERTVILPNNSWAVLFIFILAWSCWRDSPHHSPHS